MPVFEAESADSVWLLAVKALRDPSLASQQRGRGGSTSELLHVVLQVHDSRQRWVVSRKPGISIAFAIVEVIGILNGRQDSAYLNFFNPKLPAFAGSGTRYHGAYGFRLREHFGLDQLVRAGKTLRCNPESRQVVLQIWDPISDLPSDSGAPSSDDIPCNICSMLKIRDSKLEWSQIMRSNDVFRGLPYNFIQFMSLQEVVAGWIGVEPGTYSHFSDSLHVYEGDTELAFGSSPEPLECSTDSLALSRELADPVWREMNRKVDLLVEKDMTTNEFLRLAYVDNAPQAFTNLMAVVVADAARRRGNVDAMEQSILKCKNPVLRQLWERWAIRKKIRTL